jgi:phage-related protein
MLYKILYTMDDEKEIRWIGSSLDDLLGFPDDARREAGFQLGRVQAGLDPDDWKPFDGVGPGTREIRIKEASGAYRVMYVAKFEDAIYVLHCFQKKTETTSGHDKGIATTRYKAVAQQQRKKT